MDNTFVEDDNFDNTVNISKEPNMDELVQALKRVIPQKGFHFHQPC